LFRTPKTTSAPVPANKPISPPSIPAKAINIDVAGTHVFQEGGKIAIEFDAPLFSSATRLTRPARQLLAELGRQLRGQVTNHSIEIEGCTDAAPVVPGSSFRDNSALGMARAESVAVYFGRVSGIPLSSFTLATAGEAVAKPGVQSRRRQRTVVIRLPPR
jgi:flagellar motor protein MotB